MKSFTFIAMDHRGNVVRGDVQATSAKDAKRYLSDKRLRVVRVTEDRTSALWKMLSADIVPSSILRKQEEIQFLLTLGELIDAGLPMTRALSVCRDVQTRKPAKALISTIIDHVHQGKSLSEAMKAQKPCFDERLLALVMAGEESGQVGATLMQIARTKEAQHKQEAKIKAALYYPAFLVVMTILAITLLVGYVLPQFEPLFQQAGAKLPAITRGVQSFANIMVTFGPWMLMAMALCSGLVVLLRKDPRTQERVDHALLHLPLIGELTRLSSIATLCHTLGTQLKHGVPLERALELTQKTQSNMAMAMALRSVGEHITHGQALSMAFKANTLYPDLLGHMLKVGEETGNMAHAFLRLAHILDGQVNERSTRLTSLLVPLITLFLGLAVGTIVFAVMAAVMGVTKLT